MIVVTHDRVGCSAVRNKGTCANRRTISLAEIEERVLACLKAYLLEPSTVAAAVEAYRFERERLAKARAKARRAAERDLAEADRRIARILDAIESSDDTQALVARLNAAEAERAAIVARARGAARYRAGTSPARRGALPWHRRGDPRRTQSRQRRGDRGGGARARARHAHNRDAGRAGGAHDARRRRKSRRDLRTDGEYDAPIGWVRE